jgi:hypothetical protein
LISNDGRCVAPLYFLGRALTELKSDHRKRVFELWRPLSAALRPCARVAGRSDQSLDVNARYRTERDPMAPSWAFRKRTMDSRTTAATRKRSRRSRRLTLIT